MTKIFVFIFFLPMISLTVAQGATTKGKVEILFNKTKIGAAPLKGFNLSVEAPASANFDGKNENITPALKTEQKFLFDLPTDSKDAVLQFYVCDDAKTVCEQQTLEIDVKAKRNYLEKKVSAEELERRQFITVTPKKSQALVTADSKKYLQKIISTETPSTETVTKPTAEVVTTNSTPAQAVKQAELSLQKGKVNLVIFTAPWCPACIRLKSETLNQKEVKNQLKKAHLSYINIDLVENESISKNLNVNAIPTMILFGKNGKEINRWLDFQLPDVFAKELQASLTISEDIEKIKKSAESGDQKAIRRLADNLFNQMQWSEAAKWYGLSENPADVQKKLYAENNHAKDEKVSDSSKTDAYLKVLLKNIELSKSKLDSLIWTIDYFEAKSENKSFSNDEKKKISSAINDLNNLVDDQKDLAAELKNSTMTGLYDFEQLEILDVIARGYDLLSDEMYKKHTLGRMYRLAASKKINLDQPGVVIHIIYYLTQANKLSEAENLMKQLIEKYPNSYVYYNRYASFLLKQKRFDDALEQINTALKFKEGNEPQLNLVKSKILVGLKKNDEALSLVDETLKLIEPYPEKYKRTKAGLTDIKSELNTSK